MIYYSLAPSGLGMIVCSFMAMAVLPANFSLPLKNACNYNRDIVVTIYDKNITFTLCHERNTLDSYSAVICELLKQAI